MQGWDLFPKRFERGFQCFAQQQARYIVGTGWQRKSFIVGVNAERGFDRTVHHGAACPPWPQKCPQNIAASDEPDANVILGGLLWASEVSRAIPIHVVIMIAQIVVMMHPATWRHHACLFP